jgi:preprotein translocase subunit SecA
MKISCGFFPRDIQILTLIQFILAKNGRLADIKTGEGKSWTIALLVAFLTLQGKKVDIVTSNEVLAIRDSKDKEKFFKLFNKTTASNCNKIDENMTRDQIT